MATSLKIGSLFTVQIVDKVSDLDFIVSFEGRLIRVRNESLTPLKIKDVIEVRVASIDPLTFQIKNSENDVFSGANHFHRTV